MNLKVSYRGQLATAVGSTEEEWEFDEGTAISDILDLLTTRHGENFGKFVMGTAGCVSKSLLVALDGEQIVDATHQITDRNRELTLLPPIAGG